MRPGLCRLRLGFSLIELITVIGIIALMIGLLLPALVRARQAANMIACALNLRQIYQAAMNRSIEHDGYIQIAGSVNGLDDMSPQSLDDPQEKRYLWFDDDGTRRPAPLQAALAPYLGNRNVRLDSEANLVADIDQGIVRKIFTCPSQLEPQAGIMIGGLGSWAGVRVPTSYVYNEGLLGFEASPHRLRGKLSKANPAAEIVFLTDGLPRSDDTPYNAWYPPAEGRFTLGDVYANNGPGGDPTQFDPFRHPQFRMNVVFCDGHVETLVINERDLVHGVLMSE